MGWNTAVLILNDALGDIERDPEFGRNLARAIRQQVCSASPVDVSAGNHVNAASVIAQEHADNPFIVKFGGNMGKRRK